MVKWQVKSTNVREFLAELLGTCTLTCLGFSANALINLKNADTIGLILGPIAWGLALTVAIYVCGGVSGAHVNPVVTIGLASVGKHSWSKVLHYFAAQYLGSFVGALLTYIVYREAIINTKGINNSTMGIFATYPAENISTGTILLDQMICAAFFMLIICAIIDKRNMGTPKSLLPLAIGFANLGLMAISFGYNCGSPINPARDFAPRVFTAMMGWGSETFSYNNYGYFWIPIVACHIGGIIGCWTYRLFIENHWPNDSYDFGNNNNNNQNNNNSDNNDNRFPKVIRVGNQH